jgi:hypothetical protein
MHPAHVKSNPQPGNNMHIELTSGALRLTRGQTLKVVDGAGSTIRAHAGTVWITEENHARDVVLAAGSWYRLQQAGVAIVEALGDASVSFNGRSAT